MFKKIKVALGIFTGRVLTGPIEVSVDLTRKCSTNCIMCWYWSPLLNERPACEWVEHHIDFDSYLKLMEDFKRLKVKRIVLGGQGDPFLYPKIMEAISEAKKAGIEVAVITGGNYFSENRMGNLVELKVDHIDVSLHAATPETYGNIHPTLKEGTFERIKKSMSTLTAIKKRLNRKTPTLSLIDVICNVNYRDTVKMVELAAEVGAQNVGFKRIDVIDETRKLLLDNSQVGELKGLLRDAKARSVELGIETSVDFYKDFIAPGLVTGNYTSAYYAEVPCYVGWLSSRILSDGSVIPCCGCYSPALGNIHKDSFEKIWNSQIYSDFRQKSINILNNPMLVQNCKCASCIDFEFNLGVYRKLHPVKARNILHG